MSGQTLSAMGIAGQWFRPKRRRYSKKVKRALARATRTETTSCWHVKLRRPQARSVAEPCLGFSSCCWGFHSPDHAISIPRARNRRGGIHLLVHRGTKWRAAANIWSGRPAATTLPATPSRRMKRHLWIMGTRAPPVTRASGRIRSRTRSPLQRERQPADMCGPEAARLKKMPITVKLHQSVLELPG